MSRPLTQRPKCITEIAVQSVLCPFPKKVFTSSTVYRSSLLDRNRLTHKLKRKEITNDVQQILAT